MLGLIFTPLSWLLNMNYQFNVYVFMLCIGIYLFSLPSLLVTFPHIIVHYTYFSFQFFIDQNVQFSFVVVSFSKCILFFFSSVVYYFFNLLAIISQAVIVDCVFFSLWNMLCIKLHYNFLVAVCKNTGGDKRYNVFKCLSMFIYLFMHLFIYSFKYLLICIPKTMERKFRTLCFAHIYFIISFLIIYHFIQFPLYKLQQLVMCDVCSTLLQGSNPVA